MSASQTIFCRPLSGTLFTFGSGPAFPPNWVVCTSVAYASARPSMSINQPVREAARSIV